jgi:putative transposase
MSHAYISHLVHCVFGTKERLPFIDAGLESHLWPYAGGIARENNMKALAIGRTADHMHTLLSLPATMNIAKAVQLLKGARQNGSTTLFANFKNSPGKKATERSP